MFGKGESAPHVLCYYKYSLLNILSSRTLLIAPSNYYQDAPLSKMLYIFQNVGLLGELNGRGAQNRSVMVMVQGPITVYPLFIH